MKLKIIVARAAGGVIGNRGALPWHLPEDMAHFKRLTLGCPVIMGRKTWDSLPDAFRPLPQRMNIVITRQAHWQTNKQAAGAVSASSIEQACTLCPPESTAWVIGGAAIYAQAMPLACAAEVTDIEASFDGDVFAPPFGPCWAETQRVRLVSATGLPFSFITYQHDRSLNHVRT